MSNDAYIPELGTSDFYIEDMDAMYDEEEAHFHFAVHDFISLDISDQLGDALRYIKTTYPLAWERLKTEVKKHEE